jgi:hypothetical protein
MKKTIFTINVHSVVDTITNSSSELFVGTSNSKDELIKLIKEIYPSYLNEYEQVKSIDDLTVGELDNYLSYYCSPGMWPARKEQYPVPNGFEFDELYEKESEEKNWKGSYDYRLKNNYVGESEWYREYVTEENFEEIKNKLDPDRKMFFLFSLGENPDWDYQEKLEGFMSRIHMG